MSMSTSITAFRKKDATFENHKRILRACMKANVSLPKETAEYFGNPDMNYADFDETIFEKLIVELEEGIHYEYIEPGYEKVGYIIFIDKLPKEVVTIKFENIF